MSSPSPRRPDASASRSSSSAPIRTGATAPISRAPTRACRKRKCSTPFSRNSIAEHPPAALRAAVPRRSRTARCLRRRLTDAPGPTRRSASCRSGAKRRDLVEHALSNARQALGRKLAEDASQAAAARRARRSLRPCTPRRAASRSMTIPTSCGAQAIGAMIVAGPAGFMKAHYRTFNIKSARSTPGDDFGMMREVLTRRFARLAEGDRKRNRIPDALSRPSPTLS